uniref:Deoxyribose-phosphate aldolase n=1 Tax=Panagrolaimus sp. JU765 TaxID=591449 RepID=A0AC34QXN2_9BILA
MGFEQFKENTKLIQLENKEKTVESAKNLAKELSKNKEEVKKLIGYIDLTTLAGDDTKSRVEALVDKALAPVKNDSSLHCGAVCVYPARVKDVTNHLKKKNAQINVASVAGGFPSGQYLNKSKLVEIECAVEDGATEIDTVISRGEALD